MPEDPFVMAALFLAVYFAGLPFARCAEVLLGLSQEKPQTSDDYIPYSFTVLWPGAILLWALIYVMYIFTVVAIRIGRVAALPFNALFKIGDWLADDYKKWRKIDA